MTPAAPIRSEQRKKLIVLWNQYYAREHWQAGNDDSRAKRLKWLEGVTQRPIGSANDLTLMEATRAISALNSMLGLPAHKPRSRERGQAAGTHGRRGADNRAAEIVGSEELARIQRAIERLGWDQHRFDAWLGSPSSPLGHKKQIRTVGDANRVWWAMKRLLQREGKWEE
jgi:hypothetical protein